MIDKVEFLLFINPDTGVADWSCNSGDGREMHEFKYDPEIRRRWKACPVCGREISAFTITDIENTPSEYLDAIE